MITVTRFHDFSYGHRVCGHEGKCRNLHGHNGRVHFTCRSTTGLDKLGRVIDFSVIKEKLCDWVEENWDHKFLMWCDDPILATLVSRYSFTEEAGVVETSFNPTAENMASFLLQHGPILLAETGVELVAVTLEETRKCKATVTLDTLELEP